MDTMTTHSEEVRHALQDLAKRPAVHAATKVGAQATEAAAQAGGMAAVATGGIGLVVGMFLGLAMVHTTRSRRSSMLARQCRALWSWVRLAPYAP